MSYRSSKPLSPLFVVPLLIACAQDPTDPFGDAGNEMDGGDLNTGTDDMDTGGGNGGSADSGDGVGEGEGGGADSGDNGTGEEDEGDGDTGDSSDSGDTGGSEDDGDSGDSGSADNSAGSDDSGGTGDDADSGGSDDTGGTGDSGGSDGGDSGSDESEPCQVNTQTVEPIPPNVMLVLDKSYSMRSETWDHDSDGGATTPEITRWASLHSAVTLLTTTYESEVKFGAKLFPAYDACTWDSDCRCDMDPVEAACALNNSSTVLSAIPASDAAIGGYTPTTEGLNVSSTYLQTLPDTEPRVMLLVADGSGNCGGEDTQSAVDEVTTAANAGIPTYVIGIDAQDDPMDADDTFDQLSALAVAGGKPNPNGPPDFYQTQNQADLDAAMDEIISDSLSCLITIDPVPQDPDLFQVWVDGVEVPLVTDCNSEDGWMWTSQQYDEIEFCGTACDDLKDTGEMEGKYFCRPS